ncbi:hypothetical protein J8J14_21135 [Roseomonas sp. SSH11]|uniref:Uncharacterized protein n=1 Tax=Pararoseomonas baculiformis TaxID=2820812 RepID=A0ABS4AL83_9PROT|nr:hypothetical protein [Pararoseomonas baculiformis]MBP0447280.1 hypothetical protein [Pararoseomonas baculiformis]
MHEFYLPAGPYLEALVERITLKPVHEGFTLINLRLPGVHLPGIQAHRDTAGTVTLKAPERAEQHGQLWSIINLQPGVLEGAARETTRLLAMGAARVPRRNASGPHKGGERG